MESFTLCPFFPRSNLNQAWVADRISEADPASELVHFAVADRISEADLASAAVRTWAAAEVQAMAWDQYEQAALYLPSPNLFAWAVAPA